MASRTGIAMEFDSRDVLRPRRDGFTRCPKPGLSREFFLSLLMCFPLTCVLWGAIIYGASRLVR